MKKYLLSAAVLAVLCTACKKDAPVPTERFFLSMVDDNRSEIISVGGYNKLKMPGSFSIFDENLAYYSVPIYENGRLTQVFAAETRYENSLANAYRYNDAGKAFRVDFYSSGIMDRYDSLAYDNNGQLVTIYHRKITYGADYPFGIYKKDVLVWDTSGNVTQLHTIQIQNGAEGKDTLTTSYTYDKKVNFMGKPAALFMLNYERGITYLSANNMLTQVTAYPTGDSVKSVTNVYTYDNENYPVEVKISKKTIRAGVTTSGKTTDFKISYERIPIE
ncbi:hypothetical protein [Chitinophaga filiformis]|uniref:YD repeat-containing protein n=1 Tax=Chitinophaga filiformis TaxID=104663 RepID=A0ABY4HXC2_CHIFI|nr:hypothetical protein [Chitinophaga filiformis]UPK68237.1 hypothetical protein MYF79_25095 [Chitinophaga filiformis]